MNRVSSVLLCIGMAQTSLSWAAEASPADPAAPAPAATYQSAFEGYQPYRDEPIKDWRAVNDEVARIGGHIGIFRSSGGHAGPVPAAGAPAAAAPPAGDPPRAPAPSSQHAH